MANLTLTAANVVPQAGATLIMGIAGQAISQGQPCYYDSSTMRWLLSDANGVAATRVVEGVAVSGAAVAGQGVVLQTAGFLAFGAILTLAEIYVVSDTAGGIMPKGDLGAGEYVSIIGVAISTSVMKLGFLNSGAAA